MKFWAIFIYILLQQLAWGVEGKILTCDQLIASLTHVERTIVVKLDPEKMAKLPVFKFNVDDFSLSKKALINLPLIAKSLHARLEKSEQIFSLSPEEFKEFFKPGILYNFVIIGDEMIIRETKEDFFSDLLSKHVVLSNNSKEITYAGTIHLNEQGSFVMTNNSGTYKPASEGLEAIRNLTQETFETSIEAQPLSLGQTVSLETKVKQVHLETLFDRSNQIIPRVFKSRNLELDIPMLAYLDDQIEKLSHPLRWVRNYRKTQESRSYAKPLNEEKFKISTIPPLKIDLFLKQIESIIQTSSYRPFIGPTHKWSREAIEFFSKKYLIIPDKLLTALAFGKTRFFTPTGLEEKLEDILLHQYPDHSLLPHNVFKESYELAKGDLYLAMLTAESILANNPMDLNRDTYPIQQKLRYIRNDSKPLGDNYGAWYHFFGMATYALVHGRVSSTIISETETLGSNLLSKPDYQEVFYNQFGVEFGVGLQKIVEGKSFQRAEQNNDETYLNIIH